MSLSHMKKMNRFFEQALQTFNENQIRGVVNIGDTINAFNMSIDDTGICPTITTRPEGFKTAILVVTK